MFLEKLGIYGMGSVEDFILAALVTGDPILLIGEIGAAKTLLCRKIAEAMNLKFHSYDASKALFEDVIGFPNPEGFKEGKIDYVPTPISIWDKEFILIDEVSRSEPQMQNKWLEVIRERKIMGEKLKNLKYIFGAMNPPEYLGTEYLDKALAGRFAMIVPIPSIKEMENKEIKKIITTLSDEDAPMIERKKTKNNLKKEMKDFIERCKRDFHIVKRNMGNKIEKYITYLVDEFKNSNLPIDGRRTGMIYRNIISLICVRGNKGTFDEKKLPSLFYQTLLFSIPYKVTGEKFNPELFILIHTESIRKLDVRESVDSDRFFYDEETLYNLLDTVDSSPSVQKRSINTSTLFLFLSKVLSGKIKAEKSFLSSCLKIFVERFLFSNFPAGHLFLFKSYFPDLNEKTDSIALRLAFYDCKNYSDSYSYKSSDEVEGFFNEYKKVFKKMIFLKEVKK